ncbi:MAG: glycosyltransferase family 9 protein, partial [Vampirovibrionales bacterium]|nr:glycosyltransferase family 9 protein [Vampirovibrionales bacterium]
MATPLIKRILVVRHRFIGDTILTLPTLRVLKGAYPNAAIDVLVEPMSGEVLRHCPYIDSLIPFNGFWQTVNTLKSHRYDAAILLKRSFSSAAMIFLAGIAIRAGFDTEHRGWLLTHRIGYNRHRHEADCFLDVLRALSLNVPVCEPKADPALACWLSDSEHQVASGLIKPNATDLNRGNLNRADLHWGVHFSSSNPAKQWAVPCWHHLLTRALEAYPGLHLHAFGTRQDTVLIDAVFQGLSPEHQRRCFSHAAKTNIRETMACLNKLDGLIGVDSGLPHLSAALGKQTLTLFGPMSPEKWKPLGPNSEVIHTALACQPCHLKG